MDHNNRHLKIEVYRGPQTAVSGLRFVVCGMPPSCIKNRVITTHGNMGNQPKQTWRLHEGKWNCYLFFSFSYPFKIVFKLFLVLQTADKVNTLIEIESFCIKERPQGYFNCDVVR